MSDLKDPRVFFAAERTLLAWNRTSLTFMAFGFMIERFGLFLQMLHLSREHTLQKGISFWIGLAFIAMGSLSSLISAVQYRRVIATLAPVEIPVGYRTSMGVYINTFVAALGAALIACLFHGLDS